MAADDRLLELPGCRPWCRRCHRPAVTCVCDQITAVRVRTKFVFLMHPKEAKKTKNGSGRLAHLALPGSELLVGVDFTRHDRVVELLADPAFACRLLYPEPPGRAPGPVAPRDGDATPVLFVIDATWACAKKIVRVSTNLHDLARLSLDIERPSEFHIKHQPHPSCLATIEAVDRALHTLAAAGLERYEPAESERLLRPFHAMVQMGLEQRATPSPRACRVVRPVEAGAARPTGRTRTGSGRNLVFGAELITRR